MHEGQLELAFSQVVRLVARTLPAVSGAEIVPLDGVGTTSYIYRLGSRYVARFPMVAGDPEAARAELAAEHAAMAAFGKVSPFAAPEPVAIGNPGRSYPMPWSVQTWIDGAVATPTSNPSSADFAHDLAHLVGALREVDTGGRTFDGAGRGGELTDHDEWVDYCLQQSEGILPVGQLRSAWSKLRSLPREGSDVMSHKDLIPGNLVVSGDRLSGVLDTGGFGPADPALDLVCAWHVLDSGPREVLRHHLNASELQWMRGAAWAFAQAIGLVWYYTSSNPAMSNLGRNTLDRLLNDPVTQ